MNIYDALSKDHREVERILDEILVAANSTGDRWKSLLDELRNAVVPHSHAEEACFYNALRESEHGKGLVLHSYNEHAMAEGEIRTLRTAKLVDAKWTSLLQKLNKDLRHHVQEEESKVYEAARKAFTDQEAEQIGAAFERLKEAMKKDGDSMTSSTIDLVVNLLPPRLTDMFRKNVNVKAKKPHAA